MVFFCSVKCIFARFLKGEQVFLVFMYYLNIVFNSVSERQQNGGIGKNQLEEIYGILVQCVTLQTKNASSFAKNQPTVSSES